ncbi:MAG TPA: hypothetical protein DD381_13865 [Lentisphaeria bacterium]|nr:MAG: hypothetical protein A2X47_13660 [Lentisphaerae bacterium GWF2_38_69]HBM17409.1 hypothetical protein [Lentisphaeria bacterium]
MFKSLNCAIDFSVSHIGFSEAAKTPGFLLPSSKLLFPALLSSALTDNKKGANIEVTAHIVF